MSTRIIVLIGIVALALALIGAASMPPGSNLFQTSQTQTAEAALTATAEFFTPTPVPGTCGYFWGWPFDGQYFDPGAPFDGWNPQTVAEWEVLNGQMTRDQGGNFDPDKLEIFAPAMRSHAGQPAADGIYTGPVTTTLEFDFTHLLVGSSSALLIVSVYYWDEYYEGVFSGTTTFDDYIYISPPELIGDQQHLAFDIRPGRYIRGIAVTVSGSVTSVNRFDNLYLDGVPCGVNATPTPPVPTFTPTITPTATTTPTATSTATDTPTPTNTPNSAEATQTATAFAPTATAQTQATATALVATATSAAEATATAGPGATATAEVEATIGVGTPVIPGMIQTPETPTETLTIPGNIPGAGADCLSPGNPPFVDYYEIVYYDISAGIFLFIYSLVTVVIATILNLFVYLLNWLIVYLFLALDVLRFITVCGQSFWDSVSTWWDAVVWVDVNLAFSGDDIPEDFEGIPTQLILTAYGRLLYELPLLSGLIAFCFAIISLTFLKNTILPLVEGYLSYD